MARRAHPPAGGASPAGEHIIEVAARGSATHDTSITRTFNIVTHGRFAASLNDDAISENTKVFASITEVDGDGHPVLGLADTRIYSVVPTFRRVTIRGEIIWGNNVHAR